MKGKEEIKNKNKNKIIIRTKIKKRRVNKSKKNVALLI
jgi:hypothetical protein